MPAWQQQLPVLHTAVPDENLLSLAGQAGRLLQGGGIEWFLQGLPC